MSKTYTLSATSQVIDASNTVLAKTDSGGSDNSITQRVSDEIQIPNGSTDLLVSLDGLTAKYVHLKFTGGAISVKLNSNANTAISITPSASVPGVLLIAGGSITALYVSNSSGSTVTLERTLAS